MKKTTFYTGNINKLKETEQILGIELTQGICNFIEIQSTNPKTVAGYKLKYLSRQTWTNEDLFVEDSGLYLGDKMEIGALIKWFPNERVVKAYLGEMAIAVSCFCGYFNGEKKCFMAMSEGEIVEPRGEKGFGWDSIFQEKETGKTFAEMTQEEKNRKSPRYLSLMQLKSYGL